MPTQLYRAKIDNDAGPVIILVRDPADPDKFVPVLGVDNEDGTYSLAVSGNFDISLDTAAITGEGEDATTLADVTTTVGEVLAALEGALTTKLSGNTVAEQQTQADAESNVLTFSEDITSIEIWHDEDAPQEFTVNGLTLMIAPGGWRSPIGGTPGDTVTIPANVDCIVSRLV